MFDYARIGAMREFADRGQWPLQVPSALKAIYSNSDMPTSRLLRLNPLRSLRRAVNPLPYYYSGPLFYSGTRPWEYPWVLRVLRDRPSGTVLDVGCGSSEFLFQYLDLGHEVIGLDRVRSAEHPASELTPEFVAKWQRALRFLDADGFAIPLDDASVDYVVCISVLEHIVSRSDPSLHKKVLQEFRRVLRPGGLLIMTCDTFTNARVAYGGLPAWGAKGWDYADDIDFLGMSPFDQSCPVRSRQEIDADEDTFFIQPDMYFSQGYGTGFELFGGYHRMTSIGYVLVK